MILLLIISQKPSPNNGFNEAWTSPVPFRAMMVAWANTDIWPNRSGRVQAPYSAFGLRAQLNLVWCCRNLTTTLKLLQGGWRTSFYHTRNRSSLFSSVLIRRLGGLHTFNLMHLCTVGKNANPGR